MQHRVAGAPLDFAALRTELGVPGDFASDVLAEAEQRDPRDRRLPERDATELPLVTIDPAGSRDLDQALHIAREQRRLPRELRDRRRRRVRHAGLGARRRGASPRRDALLPRPPRAAAPAAAERGRGQPAARPDASGRAVAAFDLGVDAAVRSIEVGRARVRSTAQLDYAAVQAALDAEPAAGPDRRAARGRRGAVALRPARGTRSTSTSPSRSSPPTAPAAGRSRCAAIPPIERYNAEISLLTGHVRGHADAGRAASVSCARCRRRTSGRCTRCGARRTRWASRGRPARRRATCSTASTGRDPRRVAFVEHAVALLRGAAYTVFDGRRPRSRCTAASARPTPT